MAGRRTRGRGRVLALVGAASLFLGVIDAPPASAAPTERWVDALAAASGPGTGCGADAGYTTIQAAITASVADDVVRVCPGTYVGSVTINRAGLQLLGAKAGIPAGPEATPADRGTGESIIVATVANSAVNVTGSSTHGVRIDGFTVRSDLGSAIRPAGRDATVANNIVDGTRLPTAVQAGIITSSFSGHHYVGNNIRNMRYGMNVGGGASGGVPSDTPGSGVIEDNYITQHSTSGIQMGSLHATGQRIVGNTIEGGSGAGIVIPTTQMEVSGNTIRGGSTGIYLAANPRSGVVVTGNDISGANFGIVQEAPHASLPAGSPPNEAHGNNLAGNNQYGIYNGAAPGAFDLPADCNWWGSPTGPRTTVVGAGDRMTAGNVDAEPWLIAPAPDGDCTGGTLAPTATMTATPSSGIAPLTVAFDSAGSNDVDGTIVDYAWDFGDGGTATGPTATHTYATPGTYTATLTVTDDDGRTGTDQATITVEPEPQPETANDCKQGGWADYGFANQGQCIRYVNTGKDSRIGE